MKTLAIAVLLAASAVAQVSYTQITGTLLRADGTPYNGTATVAWQTFTDPSGNINPAGSIQVTIANGVPSVNGGTLQLVPNSEWNIGGSCTAPSCVLSYNVSYTFSNGFPRNTFWIVPKSNTPVQISAIESAQGGAAGPNAVISLTQIAQGGASTNYCLAWNGSMWAPSGSCGTGAVVPGGVTGNLQYNAGSNVFGGFAPGGDVTFSRPNFTVISTNGVAFAPSATTNALNASNISSGTLGVAEGGTGAGALSQYSVVFAGTGGAYSQDNSNLFWDSVNHRLGIGKTFPQYALDILSTSSQSTPLAIQSTVGLTTNLRMTDGNSTVTWNLAAELTGQFYLGDATNNVIPLIIDPNGVDGSMHIFSTGDVGLGFNPGDGGYRLDVQKSGSAGTMRVFDQTATTGSTQFAVRAGAGQSDSALVQFYGPTGTLLSGVDASGELYVTNGAIAKAALATGGIPDAGLALSSDSTIAWRSVNNLNNAGTYDVCFARNAAGVIEIDSCTAGTYRDLVLRNITINGTCSGSGCPNVTAYTLCASGCSATIPASGTPILASAHGKGAYPIAFYLDSGGHEIWSGFAINSSGDVTPTYVTSPTTIVIR